LNLRPPGYEFHIIPIDNYGCLIAMLDIVGIPTF